VKYQCLYRPIIYIYLWLYSPLLGLGRFVSFLIYTQTVGLLGRETARRKAATYAQNNINTEKTDIHASSGIRTYDHSVGAGEDRAVTVIVRPII
jgi:hypothetical protein